MKVVFLLDNKEYVEIAPEALQIRQIQPGVAALGHEVLVPLTKEDGTPDLDEKGNQKTQAGFRPFINYNVNLSIPQPAEVVPAQAAAQPTPTTTVADPSANGKAKAKPVAVAKKKAAKKKA
jgi:hypothetical protein